MTDLRPCKRQRWPASEVALTPSSSRRAPCSPATIAAAATVTPPHESPPPEAGDCRRPLLEWLYRAAYPDATTQMVTKMEPDNGISHYLNAIQLDDDHSYRQVGRNLSVILAESAATTTLPLEQPTMHHIKSPPAVTAWQQLNEPCLIQTRRIQHQQVRMLHELQNTTEWTPVQRQHWAQLIMDSSMEEQQPTIMDAAVHVVLSRPYRRESWAMQGLTHILWQPCTAHRSSSNSSAVVDDYCCRRCCHQHRILSNWQQDGPDHHDRLLSTPGVLAAITWHALQQNPTAVTMLVDLTLTSVWHHRRLARQPGLLPALVRYVRQYRTIINRPPAAATGMAQSQHDRHVIKNAITLLAQAL